MNAIIALCHFCEVHGPKVLFCTQPIHPEQTAAREGNDGDDGSAKRVVSPGLSSEPQTPQTPTASSGAKSLPNYKNDLCEGCTSVHLGLVSHDEEAGVCYISSQRPQLRDVFAMIRQACIRSLSCEVCPDREGPIFFGDDQQGHTISYTFHIQDNQARGLHRYYSIIVVMMDKIYLLNSWPFLVSNIEIVVKLLKKKALTVFQEEQRKNPHRSSERHKSVNPKAFISQRGGNNAGRSLCDLTYDKNVFKVLHMSFVWMLKACGNRLSEKLLEGPPTEDSIIDMEKQEVTEEDFVMLYSKKVGDDDVTEDRDTMTPNTTSLSTEQPFSDDDSPPISHIRHLVKLLGAQRFHILAHHVVIGNQIIVRGSGRTLIRTFLEALTSLLPKGCYSIEPYSNEYVESYKCNFLGLNPDIHIPTHVNVNEKFLLIDVFAPKNPADITDSDPLNDYTFQFASPVTLDKDSAPSVLTKMEYAIRNDNLPMEVVELTLICIKEEWMNKVKVLFTFTKTGGSRSEEDTKNLLKVVGAVEVDKPLLTYWIKGLSDHYKKHIYSTTIHQQDS